MYSRLSFSKAAICGFFLGKGAYQAGAGEVLLGLRGDVGEHGLDALEAGVDAAQRTAPGCWPGAWATSATRVSYGLMRSMKIQGDDGEQDGVGAVHDGRAEQHAHGVQVVGHAGHDVAGAMLLVEARVLPLQVVEEVVAQVELDLAGDADDDPAGAEEEDALDGGDSDQQPGIEQDLLPGDALVEIVDGNANDLREEDPDGVRDHDG